MSSNAMTKQQNSGSAKLFSKEWLIEQKSLIALIFLDCRGVIPEPELFHRRQYSEYPASNLGQCHYCCGYDTGYPDRGYRSERWLGTCLMWCLCRFSDAMEVPVMIAVPTALLAGAALGAISGVYYRQR